MADDGGEGGWKEGDKRSTFSAGVLLAVRFIVVCSTMSIMSYAMNACTADGISILGRLKYK